MKQPVIYFDHYMLRDVSVKDAKDMYEYGQDQKLSNSYLGVHI